MGGSQGIDLKCLRMIRGWVLSLNGSEASGRMKKRSFTMRFLQRAINSLIDLIPPYRTIEGSLQAKETGPNGARYIIVGDEKVEVDPDTYQTLNEGERLRIRSTRRKRAISIERLPSSGAPG